MKKLLIPLTVLLAACSVNLDLQGSKKLPTVPVAENKQPELPEATESKNVRVIELSKEQTIYLLGPVAENVDVVIKQIAAANKASSVSTIYLLIDSPGGSVIDGARLISAMEASKKPVMTVCIGMCASMAAITHQYGEKRLMLDRSLLMFHDASGALQGPIPQMRSRLDFFDRLTLKMDAYVAKRAGIDLQAFLNSLHSEVWIDAEDATARKFNDEIVHVNAPSPEQYNFYESKKQRNKFFGEPTE